MKNQIKLFTVLVIGLVLSSGMMSCKKSDNKATLEKLYTTYKNGEISECQYNGQTVYSAELNHYDAETIIFDKNGNLIGSCNYAFNQVDPICSQLSGCQVVYRIANNIWGQPAVDKYGLAK